MISKIELAAHIRAAAGHVRKFTERLRVLYVRKGDQYEMPPHDVSFGTSSDAYEVPHLLWHALPCLDEVFQLIGVSGCSGEPMNSRLQPGLWCKWPGIKATDPAWQGLAEDLFVWGRAIDHRLGYCKNVVLPNGGATKIIPVDEERWANETAAHLEKIADSLAAEGTLADDLKALPDRWKQAWVAGNLTDSNSWPLWKTYVSELCRQLSRVLGPLRDECTGLAAELTSLARVPTPWSSKVQGMALRLAEAKPVAARALDAQPGPDTTKWPTVTQAANATGISAGHLSRAVADGRLDSNGKSGSKRRIDPVSLVQFKLKSQQDQQMQDQRAMLVGKPPRLRGNAHLLASALRKTKGR